MPSLTNVYLPCAFAFENGITIEGSTVFATLSSVDVGDLWKVYSEATGARTLEERKEEDSRPPKPIVDQPMILTSENDWDRMDRTIEVMNVSDNQYNGMEWTELDLSGFVKLRKIKVGDECFRNVKKVNICGLSELESVCIGSKAFGRDDNSKGGSFCLKNCPKLKSLKMGRYSFSDYTVCEIENVDALEVIEMGDVNYWSGCFYWSSLELNSVFIHRE